MRYTLLEMVQSILRAMGGDEVNSYSDTVESVDVAHIIKESYNYLAGRMDFPKQATFFNLDASGDSTKPTLMTVPTDVINMEWIKYKHLDSSSNSVWTELTFLPIEDFMRRQEALKESETNIGTMTVSLDGISFEFKYYNDRNPTYYSNVDNYHLVFDSYDSTVDTTLQANKTLCFGEKVPTFTMSDSFTPDLDPIQFELLLNEAKSQAFVELKQMQNTHSERRAAKTFNTVQRKKRNMPKGYPEVKKTPNYGRNT